jgi:uncharacterized MAPEG superfamily protein
MENRGGIAMTTELYLLLWSAALTLVLAFVAVLGAMGQVGLPKLAGNREDMPEITGWAGRAIRAHRNMLENLVLFAILVLTAKTLAVSNATTVLGAHLFFWGRIAHAVIYLIGIPWLRTLAWAVSVIGLVLIFVQLI